MAYAATTVRVRAAAESGNDVRLYRTYRITGRTLDATGSVLSGAVVHLHRTSTDAVVDRDVSDESGAYTFGVADAANYYVAAVKKTGITADSVSVTADSVAITADSGRQVTALSLNTLVGV